MYCPIKTLIHRYSIKSTPPSQCLISPPYESFFRTSKKNLNVLVRGEVRNKEIGFVFQTFNLLPRLSSLENVALPLVYAGMSRSKRLDRAQEVLEMVGLGDRVDHKPNELSGGQRQRVAIARALVNNPSIILADEPTGNLDEETGEKVIQLLFQLNKEAGTTLVIITHDLDLANRTQQILRLKGGKIMSNEKTIAV